MAIVCISNGILMNGKCQSFLAIWWNAIASKLKTTKMNSGEPENFEENNNDDQEPSSRLYKFPNQVPFLNVPGNQFMLDLMKLIIPWMVIPFITLVVMILVFPETMQLQVKRKRRSVEESEVPNHLEYVKVPPDSYEEILK